MRFLATGLLILGLAAAVHAADPPAKPAQPSPAFEALKKEYDDAQQKYAETVRAAQIETQKAIADAKTDEEKQELQKKLNAVFANNPGKSFAPKFMEFADKNPKDPSAVDALVQALRLSGGPTSKESLHPKIVAALQANYVTKPGIKGAVRTLANANDEPSEQLVREIIAKNPDRKIQAFSCKALAAGLQNSAQLADRIKGDEKLRGQVETQWGKERVEKLVGNADKYKKSAEELTAMYKDKFGDVYPDLSVGKPVPEFVSQDVNGKESKLSDLKGKVVVLDIWATWCGPCRAMIPHEREMVERLKDKPFALVSISADEKKKTLTDFLEKEKMPWTHWWNGSQEGILEEWDVQYFPTIYVIDAKGVIRHKDLRGEELEEAVNKLLKEAESK